jgi:molybdopterin molybdotransferase
MEEEVQRIGNMIELRLSAPSGNHVISKGEEMSRGMPILFRGEKIDFTNLGLLASAGYAQVEVARIRAGIISTGDEICPVDTPELPRGCVRDANGWMLQALLEEWGCACSYYGILPDDYPRLKRGFSRALEENDLVFLSGGSSVSTRDFCEKLFRENLTSPGLLVHGINIKPGKPTLIAGNKDEKKLALGLPGHPCSGMVVMLGVVLPLLETMIGLQRPSLSAVKARLAQDLLGKTGVEEFIPCTFTASGEVLPQPSRSGYISALQRMAGFVILREHEETLRKGDPVEVLLW